jgi:hypothetical protein
MRQRETFRLGAVASEFGTGVHVIIHRSWKGKRVMCMLRDEWESMREQLDFMKEQLRSRSKGRKADNNGS